MSLPDQKIIWSKSQKLSPVRQLSEANRQVLCKSATISPLPYNERINAHDEHHWFSYLIEGRMIVMYGDSQEAVVAANSPLAKSPLFSSASPNQWAIANTPSKILRFDRGQIELLLKEQELGATKVVEVEFGKADNKVFEAIFSAFSKNELVVPGLPNVALKVRDAVSKSDVGTAEVAQIIQADPVLTGRLIKHANSAAAGGVGKLTSVLAAVNRLGLEATRSLTISLAIKQLYQGNNKMIAGKMSRVYKRSVYIAALSYVLARRLKFLDPERAQLAGLMRDIGSIPILYYADNHLENFSSAAELRATVAKLSPIVGQWVLSEWEFEQELCEIPELASDWYRNTVTEIDYVDIVIAAQLQLASRNKTPTSDIPALETVPVGKKLIGHGIDLSAAKNFFDEAREEIAIVKNIIS